MIESGTLTPGVLPAEWSLPPHTAMRVEMPAKVLGDYVQSYHVFDSEDSAGGGVADWELPGPPMIRFTLARAGVT